MSYNFARQGKGKSTLAGREHQGIVVNDVDPTGNERIQVRISGIHDKVSDADLEWVSPDRDGTANSAGTGSVGKRPMKGSKVNIKYSDDTLYHGRYTTGTNQKKNKPDELTAKDQTNKDDPHVESSVEKDGTRITHNRKTGQFDYEHPSGTHVSVDGKGNIGIRTANKKSADDHNDKHTAGTNIHINGEANILANGKMTLGGNAEVTLIGKGKVNIFSHGDITIGAKGNVYIEGQMVHLNKGAVQIPDVPQAKAQSTRKAPLVDAKAPADPTKGK